LLGWRCHRRNGLSCWRRTKFSEVGEASNLIDSPFFFSLLLDGIKRLYLFKAEVRKPGGWNEAGGEWYRKSEAKKIAELSEIPISLSDSPLRDFSKLVPYSKKKKKEAASFWSWFTSALPSEHDIFLGGLPWSGKTSLLQSWEKKEPICVQSQGKNMGFDFTEIESDGIKLKICEAGGDGRYFYGARSVWKTMVERVAAPAILVWVVKCYSLQR
jgi:hypothetical protein